MPSKKIFLLLPDGTGVRNFVYTDFIEKVSSKGIDLFLWSEPCILKLLESTDCVKIELPASRETDILAEIQRKAWQTGMLNLQAEVFNEPIYLSYIFISISKSLKSNFKEWVQNYYINKYSGYTGLSILKQKYLSRIKRLAYYKKCLALLKERKPALLFCTHQRSIKAIAPLLAAKIFGIPTACFIYSWDNLPKATLFVEADYYLVWSRHMKQEMLKYHPEIKENRILITGTPQFIPYFDENIIKEKDEFGKEYNLPTGRKWVCFSGDDLRTSPYDQIYLKDFAESVLKWNSISHDKLHIIFRRCPADKSNRYYNVLKQYSNIITAVNPEWSALMPDAGWQAIVPRKEDISLLVNTVIHSEFVVNVGSTMAHDFGMLNKPCIFIHYNVNNNHFLWDVKELYKYIHFNSMRNLNPVIWLNSNEQWLDCIESALYHSELVLHDIQIWSNIIAMPPYKDANERIVNALQNLT